MHSYKNVAVLALAASAVSPILAAPTPESQNQARAELEARAIPMWAKLLGGGVAGLTLGPQLLSSLSGGLLKKAVEESTNANTGLDQRDDAPKIDLSWIDALKGLSGRSDSADPASLSTADLIHALFSRALDELD